MSMEQEIRSRLEEAFAPTVLNVVNESHLHAGHAGDDGTGESHWRLELAASDLQGKSRVAQHRAIHAALGKGVMGTIHALSIKIL